METITLENPDKARTYHVWHWCDKCFKTWTHSQADWDSSLRTHDQKCAGHIVTEEMGVLLVDVLAAEGKQK